MSNIDPLLERNLEFANTSTRGNVTPWPFVPRQNLFIVTCIDPRTDPADFLGIEFGDAVVLRNVGGRITPAVIQDVAYVSYLTETKAPEDPHFEVAIIHHTNCGSGFLADEQLRNGFAERAGYDKTALAAIPVLDPAGTVRSDVALLLSAPQLSPRITVSGHAYDVETGLITTIVGPRRPERPLSSLVRQS